MPDPVLEKAYTEAAAVMSRSFRFAEWKFVIAAERADGIPTAFGDRDEPDHKGIKEIDREKWIYVFRSNALSYGVYSAIRAEIRVSKNGELAITPSDQVEKELKSRPEPTPIGGKTMCLPRHIVGLPQVYRFFASRIRLPLAQIKELENTVSRFIPPTVLDPENNKSVIEKDGQWLVPVVDPITVALHLHAAFAAAAEDIVNYTSANKQNQHHRAAERRSKKYLLATILKSIIGEADKKDANNLVHELKDQQGPLEDFLTHFQKEVQWRVDRRDRLGNFLVRWMASDGIRILADAYLSEKKKEFEKFLVPWAHAITRMDESPPGRKYLDRLLKDQKHFFNKYLWLSNDPTDDAIQAIRKSGMTVFEAWKTIAERKIVTADVEIAEDVYKRFHRLREIKNAPDPKGLTKGQRKQAKRTRAEARAEFKEVLRNLREYEERLLKDLRSSEPKTHFSTEPRALGAIVEAVNFVLAFSAMMKALEGDDPRAKQLAVIGFVGSTLDATSAIAALSKRWDKVAPVLGFVSGVIDVYLADAAMDKAFKDGDQDAANGNFLTGVGATMTTAAGLMALASIPGGQIVAIIGLLIVAIGFIYKLLTGKEPIERFFAHCTWGKEYLQAGGGDWSPTRFEQWTGDKEFDYQLEALLNIICKFEIASGAQLREMKFKMGWIPPDSKLKVKYEETWDSSADSRTLENEIEFTEQGPRSTAANMSASPDGKSGVKIAVSRTYLTSRDTHVTKEKTMHGDTYEVREVVPELKKIVASGRLFVTFDGSPTIAIPHKDFEKKTLHG